MLRVVCLKLMHELMPMHAFIHVKAFIDDIATKRQTCCLLLALYICPALVCSVCLPAAS